MIDRVDQEVGRTVEDLRDIGIRIGRKRCRRLMRTMGIEALVPKPSTSIPNQRHTKYPYLLRESAVSAPDEVWAADICLASLSLRAA